MSKHVLILSASPRKGGNSDLLCDAFAQGAKESGHSAEKIYGSGVYQKGEVSSTEAIETARRMGADC